MTTFEKNFKVLRRVDPGLALRVEKITIPKRLEVKASRTGLPVPKIEGISLHSTYDPAGEAKRLVESRKLMTNKPPSPTILVFGLGFGYHIQQLLKLYPQNRIVVIEPREDVLRAAMESVDLEEILRRCRLYVGKTPERLWKELNRGSARLFPYRVFEHNPSVRLNRGYFARVKKKISAAEERCTKGRESSSAEVLAGRKLKILVVSPIQGGSLPIAFYCARALSEMGYQVEVLDNSVYQPVLDSIDKVTSNETHRGQLRGLFTAFLSEMTVAKSLVLKPDLIFALAQAPLNPQVLDRLRQFGFLTAFWFVEDFRHFDYWKKVAAHYDHFFTIQRGEFFEQLEKIGVENYHYLPLAASPQIHRRVRLKKAEREEFSSDLSFVGAGYYNRRNLFTGLLDFNFKIWGEGWDLNSALGEVVQRQGRRVTTEECVKIFCASKVNVNLHSSAYHEGVNPTGDFVNPRTFEIASCGAFQLVDFRSELPELFEIDKEIITFSDLDELRAKAKYYLQHPEQRGKITRRAQKRVHRDHTYQHRMREMLEIILADRQIKGDKSLPGARGIEIAESVEELLRQAKGDPELEEFLSQFREKDRISLKDIIQGINEGKGELTRPEAIFLLLNEFWNWAKEKKVI